MNIYDQLQAVEDRYEELGELLSDPDVVSDTKRFMELSKKRLPLVIRWQHTESTSKSFKHCWRWGND